MYNKSLLLEIDRFREILNYNNLLTEVIGGVADDVVDSVIKSAMRTAIKNASKETIEKAIKAGVTDLTQVLSKKELFDKVYPEVQQELLKKGMKGVDANLQKMAITTALEKNYTNVKDELFKQVKNQASTLGTTSKQVAQNVVKTFKPGEVISNGSFVDSAIDWSKVTNAKNMGEYNKLIANALKTGDYSLISRSGFEKYGIDNFREFLQKGVDIEKQIMFDPNKGTWYFKLKSFPKTSSKLVGELDDAVVQSTINKIKKESSQEVDEIVKLSTSPSSMFSPKNKSRIVDFLENKKILSVDPTTGKKTLTRKGYATAIGLGIGSLVLIGALSENGVEIDSSVQQTGLSPQSGGDLSSGTVGGSGWRSLGKQYDDQIKTALGLPTDTPLTDADIDTLYNKLKETGKIQ